MKQEHLRCLFISSSSSLNEKPISRKLDLNFLLDFNFYCGFLDAAKNNLDKTAFVIRLLTGNNIVGRVPDEVTVGCHTRVDPWKELTLHPRSFFINDPVNFFFAFR